MIRQALEWLIGKLGYVPIRHGSSDLYIGSGLSVTLNSGVASSCHVAKGGTFTVPRGDGVTSVLEPTALREGLTEISVGGGA